MKVVVALALLGGAIELVAAAFIDYPRCLTGFPYCTEMIPRDSLFAYSFSAMSVMFALFFAPIAVTAHRRFMIELERTIIKRDNVIRLFMVIFGFNFVFVTLLCSFPVGTFLASFLPGLSGAQGLQWSLFDTRVMNQLSTPLAILLILVWYGLPAFPGPAVVALGNLLLRKDQQLESGVRSLLTSIVLLSYVIVILTTAYLLVGSLSISPGVSLDSYLTLVFGISLPGSILATALSFKREVGL
jgi:hypothetical protein